MKKSVDLILLLVFLSASIFPSAAEIVKNYPNEEDYKIATDVVPTPVGGYEAIMKKIVYPDMAIKNACRRENLCANLSQ